MSVMSRAEQRLTPDGVQAVSFRSAHLGRRGFDEEQVRAFCHQVQDELARLLSERTALQEEVSRLRRHILGRPGQDGGFGSSQADAHLQAVRILHRAEQTADHYVAEAQEYSRHLAQDAQRRRDDILAQASEHASKVMDKAHYEAGQAAQAAMKAEMALAAQATPAAGNAPPEDRRELEAELAYLRTFSDVYRTHLRAYLDALIRDINELEQAEDASAAPGRPASPSCPGRLPQEL